MLVVFDRRWVCEMYRNSVIRSAKDSRTQEPTIDVWNRCGQNVQLA